MALDDVNLRRATTADREFAFQSKKAALRPYIELVSGWNEAEQRQLHERRFVSEEYQVIQMSGTDVGVLVVAREPDCVKVDQILVLPEYQSRGIGKACMMRVIAQAEQDGLPVHLSVLKVNTRAASFYRRLGFKATGEDDTLVIMQRRPRQAR